MGGETIDRDLALEMLKTACSRIYAENTLTVIAFDERDDEILNQVLDEYGFPQP